VIGRRSHIFKADYYNFEEPRVGVRGQRPHDRVPRLSPAYSINFRKPEKPDSNAEIFVSSSLIEDLLFIFCMHLLLVSTRVSFQISNLSGDR
jgi:hypothetical protein